MARLTQPQSTIRPPRTENHRVPRRLGSSPELRARAYRQDHEPPAAIARLGWRYHHLGIPTTQRRRGEMHLTKHGLHVSGFSTSPYGIEWMRFDASSPISDLVRTIPHVAFEVDDLDAAIKNCTLLGPISRPSRGVRVAMIVDDGAPVELIEFRGRAASGSARQRAVTKRRSLTATSGRRGRRA